MINEKTLAPIDGLFDQGYKLSYFCEGLSKYEENHLKSAKRNDKVFKSLKRGIKGIFSIFKC